MKIKFTCRPRIKNSVAQKTLSKILTLGILLNSIPVTSLAGTSSEDGRYETFIDNNITVNNVLEEDNTDIKIEGNTLVNLITQQPSIKIPSTYIDCNSWAVLNGEIHGGVYSLIITVNKDIDNFRVGAGRNNTLRYSLKANERAIITFNLSDTGTTSCLNTWVNEYRLYFFNFGETEDMGEIIGDVILLEGDWANKEIPEYFEGIQSSFEDQLITQEMIDNEEEKQENLGKYKVEIKSTGRNLFNNNYSIDLTQGIVNSGLKSSNYIIINNLKYIIPSDSKLYWYALDENNNILPFNSNYCLRFFNPNNLETPILWAVQGREMDGSLLKSNTEYIMDIYYNGGDLKIADGDMYTISNIMITAEPVQKHEPYKESINTFYLNSPLLEGDTIKYINGQAYHVKNYTKAIADETRNDIVIQEDFANQNNTIGFNVRGFLDGNASYGLDDSYSDKFTCYPQMYLHNNDIEGISQGFSTLYIRITRSKLSSEDVEGFKKWLKDNPINLIYKLANPIYEPIKADLSIQLFEGTTHILNNSNIPTNMEITVDRTINKAVEAIELAKENPTIENISLARMWTNLLKESTLKDEINNQINDITQVVDLEIEKKTVSANIDVYVKSDNALSMILSTNSIIFDNYSGVNDMEKLNALEVTVHSSLPYSLNAYLETEIQNSDKSTTIDSNLLQIRNNGESEYKAFSNTTDNIVLEESCPSGNYNKHNIDLKMEGSNAYKADIYKTTIKFEAEQI